MRRFVLFAAAPAGLILALSPVVARADLAPPGDATATALQVGTLVGVSDTGAHAASDGASGTATVLGLGGQPVLGLGGSQQGEGESHGALVDAGATGVGTARVAPWETSVHGTGATGRTARGRAAAARVHSPGILGLDVAESESQASYRPARSTGSGFSNGAHLRLFDDLDVIVLHSEVSSEGEGSSYLVQANGTRLGTDEDLGRTCAFDASPLLRLACLAATGGLGADAPLTSAAAGVATVHSDALTAVDPTAAFAATASSGTGTLPAPAVGRSTEAPATSGEAARSATLSAPAPEATVAAETSSRLPRTGAETGMLVGGGLLVAGLGAAVRRLARRRAAVA
jgi:hypothetical protein